MGRLLQQHCDGAVHFGQVLRVEAAGWAAQRLLLVLCDRLH